MASLIWSKAAITDLTNVRFWLFTLHAIKILPIMLCCILNKETDGQDLCRSFFAQLFTVALRSEGNNFMGPRIFVIPDVPLTANEWILGLTTIILPEFVIVLSST